MKSLNSFILMGLVAGTLGTAASSAWAKDGVLSSVKSGESNYCHMHFPAMREDTLSWNSPVLKDATTGEIIHYYGSCDYDPHGKDAVQAQKRDQQRRWQQEYNSN